LSNFIYSAYPPADPHIRTFFDKPEVRQAGDQPDIERRYIAFFAALFERAIAVLPGVLANTPESDGIPERWRNYLSHGATSQEVGKNRKYFYEQVVEATYKVQAWFVKVHTLSNLNVASRRFPGGQRLKQGHEYLLLVCFDMCLPSIAAQILEGNCKEFIDLLGKHLLASRCPSDQKLAKARVLFFMYFDEAHSLTKTDQVPGQRPLRSKFHLLGRVLAQFNTKPFFGVFLSTNSWLGAFAPRASDHPSTRDWEKTELHAPFTELPFDVFAENSYMKLTEEYPEGVMLPEVCTLSYIVKFGRPL
jgi:hypothetical protein